jgi:hypothetical protein
MSGRYDVADFEWSVIQPLLPNKPRGVPRADDRRVLNGIRVLAAGSWRVEEVRFLNLLFFTSLQYSKLHLRPTSEIV